MNRFISNVVFAALAGALAAAIFEEIMARIEDARSEAGGTLIAVGAALLPRDERDAFFARMVYDPFAPLTLNEAAFLDRVEKDSDNG